MENNYDKSKIEKDSSTLWWLEYTDWVYVFDKYCYVVDSTFPSNVWDNQFIINRNIKFIWLLKN